MQPPETHEYAAFYAHYIDLVPQADGLAALQHSRDEMVKTLQSISPKYGTHRYAPEKWSINEVLQHCIDTELIFLYRAVRIARNDKTPLPGFEQDDYIKPAQSDELPLASLIDLFLATRALTIKYFAAFPKHTHAQTGTASNSIVSVRALCFMISGHGLHHLSIIKNRYL
jgi:hypothetical protein